MCVRNVSFLMYILFLESHIHIVSQPTSQPTSSPSQSPEQSCPAPNNCYCKPGGFAETNFSLDISCYNPSDGCDCLCCIPPSPTENVSINIMCEKCIHFVVQFVISNRISYTHDHSPLPSQHRARVNHLCKVAHHQVLIVIVHQEGMLRCGVMIFHVTTCQKDAIVIVAIHLPVNWQRQLEGIPSRRGP